jgi:isoleucyl-tRNA synthetase
MYEMFSSLQVSASDASSHVLDKWMVARTNEMLRDMTLGYKNYELDKATRPLADCIDDLSVWYLRRSRERLKGDDEADKKHALATLRWVLKNLALGMAPVMPFYAEYLFGRVREANEAESVHLMAWPTVSEEVELSGIEEMKKARIVVTFVLEARSKANIKVRQPIASITGPELSETIQSVVLSEVNAKKYIVENVAAEDGIVVAIDPTITPELKREGDVRELMRAIQDARKEMGLVPEDRIVLTVDGALRELMAPFESEVLRTTGASEVKTGEGSHTITIDGTSYSFALEKN